MIAIAHALLYNSTDTPNAFYVLADLGTPKMYIYKTIEKNFLTKGMSIKHENNQGDYHTQLLD